MQSTWHDTIIALATPPGVGAIGVLRLSGANAVSLVNRFFPSKDLLLQPSHTLHVGWIKAGVEPIDEVVVGLYKAPKSYTGEDVVEISAHGSPYILQQLLELFTAAGARLARPGEFTQRAFLNGKKDLAQAEAVADIIASQTEAARRTAMNQMRGGFSRHLAHLREELIQFGALIELELDFATEDVEFADRTRLSALLTTLQAQVDVLLQSFKLGNVIKQGVQVAIVGKPNAGKSTLLNRLLNENRAIVSDIAGTTRDTIEETLNIEGILFRLIDTAGIREHTTDVIETIGIEKSLEKMKAADLVLYVADLVQESADEMERVRTWLQQHNAAFLIIGNKCDAYRGTLPADVIAIAAKDGLGVDTLKQAMVAWVLQGQNLQENVVVTNARHYEALRQVALSLSDIQQGMLEYRPGDLLALDIRRCLHYLGEITGQITNEDQLDYIFSKFCIGK